MSIINPQQIIRDIEQEIDHECLRKINNKPYSGGDTEFRPNIFQSPFNRVDGRSLWYLYHDSNASFDDAAKRIEDAR